jgi:peptidoglycan/LPS O-acetylase OafA/YrhL
MKIYSSPKNILKLTDFCKGLAISLVFLIHYQDGWFAWQGVAIFIVLSGFGLTYSCLNQSEKFSWKAWWLKRARRILPVYWLVVLCSLPLIVLYKTYLANGVLPGLSQALNFALKRTVTDLVLLTNFFPKLFGGPTGQLWFIPFIVSCYLVFPFIYHQFKKASPSKNYLLLLLIAMAVEFVYRAVSIYWLDGIPIGYDPLGRFFSFIHSSVTSFDRIPEPFPFQGVSLMCLFPARIAEFTLGIFAAFSFVENRQRVNKFIFSAHTGIIGLVIWLAGQLLIYVGLWGWIFSDFVIAFGLILWSLNLAHFCQKSLGYIFQCMTTIGIWSYYIYLTHEPILRLFQKFITRKFLTPDTNIISFIFIHVGVLTITIASVYVACRLVRNFDESKFPELIIHKIRKSLIYS